MDVNKTAAIIFILLMVGSTLGATLVKIFGNEDEGTQLPTEQILNYKLSEYQRKELLRRGYTLVEYEYPQNCFTCETQKMNLEGMVGQSDNQIFLQEIQYSGSESKISIASVKGSDVLTNPTDEEVMNSLCEVLLERPVWCIQL